MTTHWDSERAGGRARVWAAVSGLGGVAEGLARVAFYGAVALVAVAIALGRSWGPAADGSDDPSAAGRRPRLERPTLVDGFWWVCAHGNPRGFDAGSETWRRSPFPDGDLVERASIAPWV